MRPQPFRVQAGGTTGGGGEGPEGRGAGAHEADVARPDEGG